MKSNEAPEKIYLTPHTLTDGFCNRWFEEPFKAECIEYVRKDAFIEKACELLSRMIWEVTYEDLEGNSVQHNDKMEFIEGFKNYMKGE